MSFPHNNNTLRTTVTQLKEAVARHQGEQHETVKIVREMESIVAEIERKAIKLSISIDPISDMTNSTVLSQSPVPVA